MFPIKSSTSGAVMGLITASAQKIVQENDITTTTKDVTLRRSFTFST